MKKPSAIAGVILAGVILVATPALAAASTIAPNPVTVAASDTTKTVTVTYSGIPANKRLFLTVCYLPTTDSHFDPFASCSNLSEVTVNPSDNPGSGTVQFAVFHGAEPSGDDSWGCFGSGETAPAGITKNTTCYVRITDDSEINLTDQQSIPFTFDVGGTVTPPPSVPESSLPIALPLLGVAAAGATLVAMRRRRTRAAV
jgi:hypothetical protein